MVLGLAWLRVYDVVFAFYLARENVIVYIPDFLDAFFSEKNSWPRCFCLFPSFW